MRVNSTGSPTRTVPGPDLDNWMFGTPAATTGTPSAPDSVDATTATIVAAARARTARQLALTMASDLSARMARAPTTLARTLCAVGSPDGRGSTRVRRGSVTRVNTIIVIAGVAVLVIGAMALGLKFFNTSVRDEEDGKNWEE